MHFEQPIRGKQVRKQRLWARNLRQLGWGRGWGRRQGAVGGAGAVPAGGRVRPDADPAAAQGSDWREDEAALAALDRIEAEPWVAAVDRERRAAGAEASTTSGSKRQGEAIRLRRGRRASPTWPPAAATPSTSGAPTRPRRCTSATSATSRSATRSPRSLKQAGARVENRSLICDVGRSMGEAMAGVATRAGEQHSGPDGDEKSDHFVGFCYADYVTASKNGGLGDDGAEDSVARESALVRRQGRRADDARPRAATRRRSNCGRRPAPG